MECVVCGFKLTDENPRLSAKTQGESFPVCCPSCEAVFSINPAAYAQGKAMIGKRV